MKKRYQIGPGAALEIGWPEPSGNKGDDTVSDEAEDDSEDSEKILTQDEIQKIVKQAEFYLSEEYLMKNAYLLRQVARKRNGYLSIKFITSFKRMRELSPNWKTTAASLKLSEKLELSEDGLKVRRKTPLANFISSIKSIKSVVVTSDSEMTVAGLTSWLSCYGEIIFVQVIKEASEIPENLKPYASKHPEFGTIPVGVVEFDTPEAAHRCCRDIDNFGDDGSRVCLLGTRIRSFTRQRRKRVEDQKSSRLSPVDSGINVNSSSNESSDLSSNDSLEITTNQIRPPKKQQVIGSQKANMHNNMDGQYNKYLIQDQIAKYHQLYLNRHHQLKLIRQENHQRNLQAMQFQQHHQNRIQDHYRHLMVAHGGGGGHDSHSFDSSYDSSMAMLKAPPPGLEPESESRHRFGTSSLSTWIENMSI